MTRLILSAFFLLVLFGHSNGRPKQNIKDGLYLIVSIDTTAEQRALPAKGTAIHFSKFFEEFDEDSLTRIVIDTKEYVPLELEKTPVTEQQTELKKKLLLTLTPAAAEKLKSFTAKYVMHRVAVVVDGEVLTMHKIKTPITSGQLQITRCTDNACEKLYIKLKDNVKN